MRLHQCLAVWSIALSLAAGAANAALVNPGFEANDASAGDVYGATGWNGFNFYYTSAAQQRTGSQSLKLYGDFSPGGASGAFQDQPATAGELYSASAWALNPSADPIQGSNFGLVQLIFLNSGGTPIGTFESPQFGSSATQDTWTSVSATGVAPVGTTNARIQLLHVQANNPVTGGSVYFDDTSLAVVPEPSLGLAGLTLLVGFATRRRRQ